MAVTPQTPDQGCGKEPCPHHAQVSQALVSMDERSRVQAQELVRLATNQDQHDRLISKCFDKVDTLIETIGALNTHLATHGVQLKAGSKRFDRMGKWALALVTAALTVIATYLASTVHVLP